MMARASSCAMPNEGGLTTAATVWVTAALGIACGLGAWRGVAVAVPVALVLLVLVPWIENALSKDKKLLE